MSFASSWSSAGMALRSAVRANRRPLASMSLVKQPRIPGRCPRVSRNYATDQLVRPESSSAADLASEASRADREEEELGIVADESPKPTPPPIYRGSSHLTGPLAQEYLSHLLQLSDPSRQFHPKLALQILTHKSYRFVALPKSPNLVPAPTAAEIENRQIAAHNARLSFVGRRAIASYLTMFLHAAAAERASFERSASLSVGGLGLLRPRETLGEKVEKMMHVINVGRAVGRKWGIDKVARWDGNPNTDGLMIFGTTVQAVIGGVYTEFGSPAAHRAFHLFMLPELASQLRDPSLIEKVSKIKDNLDLELGGGILVPRSTEEQ